MPRTSLVVYGWRALVAIGAVLVCALGCSDTVGTSGRGLGTFQVGILFDDRPNAPGGGTLTFTADGDRLSVTGEIAMPTLPNTFTRFNDGTIVGTEVRFSVAGESWQFEGTMTSDGQHIVGRHTRIVAGVTSPGSWGAHPPPGPVPPPF